MSGPHPSLPMEMTARLWELASFQDPSSGNTLYKENMKTYRLEGKVEKAVSLKPNHLSLQMNCPRLPGPGSWLKARHKPSLSFPSGPTQKPGTNSDLPGPIHRVQSSGRKGLSPSACLLGAWRPSDLSNPTGPLHPYVHDPGL